ncbi:MAG: hypothetical protein J6K82_00870 [Alphaproteobacteria bacterium]|nr:hypothetical protein [Alphaproteobacteria bacterium]
MALKPKTKRKLYWTLLSIFGAILLSIVIVPPMINLNGLKPIVEKSVYEQTLVPAKLNGDIHFSLVGGATIVAHDVVVPDAKIGSVLFSIPFRSFFDIKNAKLNGPVVVYDAEIVVEKLKPAMFNHNIELYNSNIYFAGHKFHIIRADFTNGEFHGTIRTDEHKYEVEFAGNTFYIRNRNNNLEIVGHMTPDGSVYGNISLETTHINEWFGFSEPQIDNIIKMTSDFEWNGAPGYTFKNINADNFSGNITVHPNGDRDIQLVSDNLEFDFSFLLNPKKILHRTNLNLDLYGKLKFDNQTFNHLRVNIISNQDKVQINDIIADDIKITGGTITDKGAENITLEIPFDGITATCLFSGTADKWQCSKFKYGNLSGSLFVTGDKYNMFVESDAPMPTDQELIKIVNRFGTHGVIRFRFSNMAGTYTIDQNKITPSYTFAKDKTLKWLNTNIPFLPKFMLTDSGDYYWDQGMLTFTPYNNQWKLSTYENYFHISGTSFKTWFPNIDLQSVNDDKYTISGFWDGDKISNLKINISGHEFTGSASGKNITLHTDTFVIGQFLNQEFFNNYDQMEFLANAPILIPFTLPVNIALSANKLIYDNTEYMNFVYTLRPNVQTFSITDSSRGNLLATIEKSDNTYDISIQLNRFLINGELLSDTMPLNIRDTLITAEISLTTHGQIAHDIYYNLSGIMDLTFDGGYILGIGIDDFYASAENITTLNAEYALSNALGGGVSKLKTMRIIGNYERGNFITTEPIQLSLRHTTGIGGLGIQDGLMTAEFDLTLRGTAPTPATIELGVLPDGGRSYSLSAIMQEIDPGFMRVFVKTRDKF